jgi:hypothetical protein
MPRNMSFAMTTEAYRRREKTVTRRDGWWKLRPGEVFTGCVKCMGPEPLRRLIEDPEYGRQEMIREGFPGMEPREFCDRYIRHNGGDLATLRNRIEFEHLPEPECLSTTVGPRPELPLTGCDYITEVWRYPDGRTSTVNYPIPKSEPQP